MGNLNYKLLSMKLKKASKSVPEAETFVDPNDKNDEIIGVKVMQSNEVPNPLAKPKPVPQEETKEAPKTLPDPKKKLAQNKQKATIYRDEDAFSTYIFRVCKEVCPDSGISKKAMKTLNHIVADKFEQIMNEARSLNLNNKKGTITSKEVETACRLLIRGDLGTNAVHAGRKAISKYSDSAKQSAANEVSMIN